MGGAGENHEDAKVRREPRRRGGECDIAKGAKGREGGDWERLGHDKPSLLSLRTESGVDPPLGAIGDPALPTWTTNERAEGLEEIFVTDGSRGGNGR